MKRPDGTDPYFVPGYGWEVDLDERNSDAETLARFDAPDFEQAMPLEEWEKLYAEGKTYYQLNPKKD